MHIPEAMLDGTICPVTAAMSSVGVISATYFVVRAKSKPALHQFGALTSLLLVAQMLNFPILNGSSGHLLGGVLAASLLGIPLGILSMSLVISIQALVFSDGGILVLGANVFNMALVGAGLGGFLFQRLKCSYGENWALGIASWFSVVIAAQSVSTELAINGNIDFSTVSVAMFGWHSMIGFAEALITIALFRGFSNNTLRSFTPFAYATLLLGILLIPFASKAPDGLERVAHDYHLASAESSSETGL